MTLPRAARLAVLPAAALLAVSAAAAAPAGETVRVGRIIILRKEVFNPSVPGYDRFPFRWLNALHIRTRERVIREALLFQEGEPYDPDLLAETERNLRQLDFINYASVVPGGRCGAVQDVVVETHDIWSTQLSLTIDENAEASGEGEKEYEARIEEHNLLGTGKRLDLLYNRRGSDDGLGWLFFDPQFFDTRWTLGASRRRRGDGRDWAGLFRRPFYSLDTRWGGGVRLIGDDRENAVFREDAEIARYRRDLLWESVSVGRMTGTRRRKLLVEFDATRARRRYADLTFSEGVDADSTLLPEDEDLRHFGIGGGYGRFRFYKEKQIDFFEQVEDMEVGGFGALSLGPLWNTEARWRFTARSHAGIRRGPGRYVYVYGDLASDRFPGEWRRTTFRSAVRCYDRWSVRNTLALRLAWEEAWKDEAGREFAVGGSGSLRGYGDRSDTGQRRLLFNLENRFFTDLRLLTVAFGAALFFDAGAAWDRGEAVRLDDVRSSTGAGLRLGLTKVRDAKVVRFDVALNLHDGSIHYVFAIGHPFRAGRPFSDFIRDATP